MGIRCHHLGVIAGLSLMLSVAAASLLPEPLPVDPANAPAAEQTSPVPAPVLFLAGGLLAAVAMVRWRQKLAANAE